jgi:hypothetical protein
MKHSTRAPGARVPVQGAQLYYEESGEGEVLILLHGTASYDMQHWTDHGSPLKVSDFKWAKKDAFAGDVARRNGKYYT